MLFRFLISILLVLSTFHLQGKAPIIKKDKQPKRIIRMCCAFGTNIKVLGLPFITLNKVVDINNLGHHQYLNAKSENNGIIYTELAGFIDIAHVRDQADWTAYLYHKLSSLPQGIPQQLNLGKELGNKTLSITIPETISQADLLNIAGNIAYDLSTWHEIASWFGATQAPILNEKFSSFSFEDNFSNALGVHLGKQAVLSHQNYNTAMDSLLLNYLETAIASTDVKSTEDAMNNLAKDYWNPNKSIPNKKLLVERNFNYSKTVSPITFCATPIASIEFPSQTSNDLSFGSIYTLSFKTGYRFPLKKVFPTYDTRFITTQDFPTIIKYIQNDVLHIKK